MDIVRKKALTSIMVMKPDGNHDKAATALYISMWGLIYYTKHARGIPTKLQG